MSFPARKDQYGRVTLESLGEHLGTLNTKANTIILYGRQSGLCDARTLRKLILAKPLQLTDNADRLTNGHLCTLLRWAKLAHL
jgi:hypothetical protein